MLTTFDPFLAQALLSFSQFLTRLRPFQAGFFFGGKLFFFQFGVFFL